MPYSRFALYMRRFATCASCGRRVRIRGFELAVGIAIVAGLAALAYFFFIEPDLPLGRFAAILAVAAALSIAVDWAMWRWLGFSPAPDASEAGSPPAS